MEHRQRRPCHAGTLPAGTVAPGSVPAPAARHRNGEQTPPPTICTGTHPAQQIAPPVQTEGQSSSAPRAAALAFFFCRAFTRLPPARPAGSADRHTLGVVAVATMTTPAPRSRSRSRSRRPPPAPGRISTASAAPDDHASSRPPPTMTTHQRQPCTTCTAPTASSQQRQTSQQPAPAACTYQQHQRTPQPCRLPAAADQHHPRPPNGPKPAHRGPLPEGSDSLPDRHIDFAV